MAAKLCNICNIRRVYTGSKGTETAPSSSDMCNYCYEEGSYENQHSDNGHDAIQAVVEANGGEGLDEVDSEELKFMAYCWICRPELNLAKKPKGASTGTKTQGVRRPQLNHKGHSHPQTPAARRACKLAFWAQSTVEAAAWDCKLDGYGKEIKPVAMTVTPRGPKGGVINKLKEGKPAKGTSLGRAERAHAKAAGLIK